jgi:hypothetical protein
MYDASAIFDVLMVSIGHGDFIEIDGSEILIQRQL